MPKSITYAELFRLLLDLDFVDTSVRDSHLAYRHVDSDTMLLFGLHDPNEALAPHDVAKVRRMLDERGLLKGTDFDAFLASGRVPASS